MSTESEAQTRIHKSALAGLLSAGIAGAGLAAPSLSGAGLRGQSGPIVARLTPNYALRADIVQPRADSPLRVMSLNLAHGRGRGAHQALSSPERIKENLESAARSFRDYGVHAVALQEADGPSRWSGAFDHVEVVAERAGMAAFAHGRHVEGLGLRYGTALLADRPFESARSHTFAPDGPLPPKGFTRATIRHQGCPIELVSLHLDFASEARRHRQVDALATALRGLGHPLVLMGDFNSEWAYGSAIDKLARVLGLTAFQPRDRSLLTFPKLKRRLDWILVSPELRFRDYHSPELDQLSDHRPVVAELDWREDPGACYAIGARGDGEEIVGGSQGRRALTRR